MLISDLLTYRAALGRLGGLPHIVVLLISELFPGLVTLGDVLQNTTVVTPLTWVPLSPAMYVFHSMNSRPNLKYIMLYIRDTL